MPSESGGRRLERGFDTSNEAATKLRQYCCSRTRDSGWVCSTVLGGDLATQDCPRLGDLSIGRCHDLGRYDGRDVGRLSARWQVAPEAERRKAAALLRSLRVRHWVHRPSSDSGDESSRRFGYLALSEQPGACRPHPNFGAHTSLRSASISDGGDDSNFGTRRKGV